MLMTAFHLPHFTHTANPYNPHIFLCQNQQNVEKLGKLPSDVENLLTFPTRSKFVKKFQNGVSDDKTSHIFLNILSHGGNRVEGEG